MLWSFLLLFYEVDLCGNLSLSGSFWNNRNFCSKAGIQGYNSVALVLQYNTLERFFMLV